MIKRTTPKIIGKDNGIASLESMDIGGLTQFLLIRGQNVKNPILLYIHGGPGIAAISFARTYMSHLEEHFIVVNWDQRGAGLSYSKDIPESEMTIEHFVRDIGFIADALCERFNQKKLFLVASSWGSVIGTLAVQRYPERFHAYIGLGQIANMNKSERISYEYVMQKARETQNGKALKELEKLGQPPFSGKALDIQRKWLATYGGYVRNHSSQGPLVKMVLKELMNCTEYTFFDIFTKYLPGRKFSNDALWGELLTINFFERVPEWKVPIFFFIGRHDYLTTFEVAEEYFNFVEAPYKEYIWFENSAHMALIEENEKFTNLLIEKVRPLAD
ncbi:alpha/beta fold hydrolase [Pseudoneobacillus sp. C159]